MRGRKAISGPNNTSVTRSIPLRCSANSPPPSRRARCRPLVCRSVTRDSGAERHSSNSAAYEHYLRGRYHWAKDTIDGLQKARDSFQQAIELDPSVRARLQWGGRHLRTARELRHHADRGVTPAGPCAALKALTLDESLAEAHRSLAAIIADHYWDWGDVDRHYARALALDPNDVTTLRFYSFYLAYTGRPTEALPIAERACRLDPVSPNARMNLGSVLHLARRDDEAARQFEEALDLDPNFALAHALLGLTYLSKAMPDRAVAALQKARDLSGARPDIVALQGYALARAGHKDEALNAFEDLHRLTHPRQPSPFMVALVYVGLEDTDRAFEWLEKAIEARSWESPMLRANPIFDSIRSYPRFPPLLERIGLSD